MFSKQKTMTNEELLQKIAWDTTKENKRSRRWSIFFKLLTFFYLFILLYFFYDSYKNISLTSQLIDENHIAVVNLNGAITYNGEYGASNMIKGLEDAFSADNSDIIVININSPGGSPVQSDQIYNAIIELKTEYNKPVYSVINDTGASGAYYIASATDFIYSNPMSLVGSIGVVSGGFGFSQAMENIGIERRLYTAGESKSMLDPFSPEDEEQVKRWNEVLTIVHKQFIEAVKNGRGDRLTNEINVFTGQVWSGVQALELGLIDEFKSLRDIKLETDLPAYNYSYKPKSLTDFISNLGITFINKMESNNQLKLQ
jgi:protease-4